MLLLAFGKPSLFAGRLSVSESKSVIKAKATARTTAANVLLHSLHVTLSWF